MQSQQVGIKSVLWTLLYFQIDIKFWSSNTLPDPKSLSTGYSAVKSVRDPASELGLHELSLSESQLPAKASKRQRNPCFSHNQEVCPAVSAIELMLGNLQPNDRSQ